MYKRFSLNILNILQKKKKTTFHATVKYITLFT